MGVWAILMFLAAAAISRADMLLGTLSWPMHGTADTFPGEVCWFGFGVQGLPANISVPQFTNCGTVDQSWGNIWDGLTGKLTNGVDDTLAFGASLSMSSGTEVKAPESSIPKAPGVPGPDFHGYELTRLVSSGDVTEAHLLGCDPSGLCIGPWEFDATGRWQIYGTTVPEDSPLLWLPLAVIALALCQRSTRNT